MSYVNKRNSSSDWPTGTCQSDAHLAFIVQFANVWLETHFRPFFDLMARAKIKVKWTFLFNDGFGLIFSIFCMHDYGLWTSLNILIRRL